MGWTYEVEGYGVVAQVNYDKKYGYIPLYTGESLVKALHIMLKNRNTYGALKFTWRPS